MEDRELLNLAVKAAGLQIVLWQPDGTPHAIVPNDTVSWRWNPLTDDGDALRLAVKLDLLHSPRVAHEIAVERFTKNADKLTATRRAIVRAAAALASAPDA